MPPQGDLDEGRRSILLQASPIEPCSRRPLATGRLTASVAALQPGVSGNCPVGTVMSLGVAVPGVTSQGRASSDLTGGSNTEDQEAFRARVMDAYREPPRGGAEMDYATWAISVPGVTRAWCLRNGYGAGTVVVYIMLDAAQAGHDGFPVGRMASPLMSRGSAGSWGPVDRGECALSIAAGDGVGICVFTASQFTDPDAGGIKWRQLIHTRSNCSGCCGSP